MPTLSRTCSIVVFAVTRSLGPTNRPIGVLAGGGFDEGRPEPGRGEHESATLEVRGTHAGTAADGADVAATSAAVTVPFASSEDDRNLQAVSISSVVCVFATRVIRAKLHYTDTGYGHHQRTSSQQFYHKFVTSQCQSPTSRHVKMLGCGKFLSVGGVRWRCS